MITYDYAAEHQIRKVKDNVTEFTFRNETLDYSRIISIQKNPPKIILKVVDDRTGDIIEVIETDPFSLGRRQYSDD